MTASCGPLAPLRRDKQTDFACAHNDQLYAAQVRHVLLTQGDSHHGAGELPWRTECGSALHTVRHASLDAASDAMVRRYVEQAFNRWLPHLRLLSVDIRRLDAARVIEIAYSPRCAASAIHSAIIELGGA